MGVDRDVMVCGSDMVHVLFHVKNGDTMIETFDLWWVENASFACDCALAGMALCMLVWTFFRHRPKKRKGLR